MEMARQPSHSVRLQDMQPPTFFCTKSLADASIPMAGRLRYSGYCERFDFKEFINCDKLRLRNATGHLIGHVNHVNVPMGPESGGAFTDFLESQFFWREEPNSKDCNRKRDQKCDQKI